MSDPDRQAQVLARLSLVSDPELDEPVTELGFITGITIVEPGVVEIAFRLPTYWCAANFAFMMADDMRREVAALPWVTRVEPRLGEHMYAERINRGVAQGWSFAETFRDTSDGGAAVGELDRVRHNFLVKAFQRRQEALLRDLLGRGHPAGRLVALSIAGLQAMPLDETGERLRTRYLQRRNLAGPVTADAPAFVQAAGTPVCAVDLSEYLRMLGRVNVSAEFNGALCRGLLAARFAGSAPALGSVA